MRSDDLSNLGRLTLAATQNQSLDLCLPPLSNPLEEQGMCLI